MHIAMCSYIYIVVLVATSALGYSPHPKEAFLTDALLREVVERMGKDLTDAANSYLGYPDSRLEGLDAVLGARGGDDYGPLDADPEEESQLPALRDQEYLQHSHLWGHQRVAGGAGEGQQRLKPDGAFENKKQVKTDAVLPAYCNPPNPCPVGYSGEDGCLEEFENSATFSREFQASQDCMCDTEHMFDCPEPDGSPSLNKLMEEMQVQNQHKSLVAKKFNSEQRHADRLESFRNSVREAEALKLKSQNPYLTGEKLPIAAKKGINIA